jgi:hypothetical protein
MTDEARASRTSSGPPCAAHCRDEVRRIFEPFSRGVEVFITWAPPLFPSGYDPLGMTCPHGVLWFMEPTAEGRARLAELPLDSGDGKAL